MRERVYTRQGKTPAIIVAPHGVDDTNTADIALSLAEDIDAFAVINQGFERAEFVDVERDLADCNKISHVQYDVIREEYLVPFENFKNHITTMFSMQKSIEAVGSMSLSAVHIFHIHGCGDVVHQEAGEKVSVILGYGLGGRDSCDSWLHRLLVEVLRDCPLPGEVYEGKAGGRYSGAHFNNMNQYYRTWLYDPFVQSVQLELPYSCRSTPDSAKRTGRRLGDGLAEYLERSRTKQDVFLQSNFI